MLFFLLALSFSEGIANLNIASAQDNKSKRFRSAKLMEENPQCEPKPDNYKEIKDHRIPFGNIYACNVEFNQGITISMLLLIYSCQFNNINGESALYISCDYADNEGSVIIRNTQFNSCKSGAVYVSSKDVFIHFSFIECTFEQCSHEQGAAIYFNSQKAEIIKCSFINNDEFDGGGDIYYKYVKPSTGEASDNLITIDQCVFERKNGANAKGSLLSFSSGSKFAFTNNQINIQSQVTTKVFYIPDGTDQLKGLEISGNKMNPYREDILDNFKEAGGEIGSSFEETPPIQCPPIPFVYEDTNPNIYIHDCESTYDDELPGNRGFYSNTLCGIYFSTFYGLQLDDNTAGAAVYITTDQTLSQYKEPVKIYKCDFSSCMANIGGAVYIESKETGRLFDINGSTFTRNSIYDFSDFDNKKGGAIFINAPLSCVKIADCTFNSNDCGNGGAIYYESGSLSFAKTASILDINDDLTYSLNVIDCKFTGNNAKSNGGAIYISITNANSLKQIEINNCMFSENEANHKDSDTRIAETGELGGAVYFSFDSDTDNSNFIFRVIDSDFVGNKVTHFGGALYLSLTKNHISNQIEINHCTFNKNIANNEIEGQQEKHGSGADICYSIDSTSTASATDISAKPSLRIYLCDFTGSESLVSGGSIMIDIQNDETPRNIEITSCNFKENKAESGGSIMISAKTKDSINSIEITDCTFTENEVQYGGAIFYGYTYLSSTSSKKLLDAKAGTNDYSLFVKSCVFSGLKLNANGGALLISIIDNDPNKPIEINNCTFENFKDLDMDIGEENGGSIYYSFSTSSSTAKKLMETREGETEYTFSVVDCSFSSSKASYYGGALYIKITNAKQPKHLEILRCSFNDNSATNNFDEGSDQEIYKGYGGDIYYSIDSVSASATKALHIKDCNFSNSHSRIDGGSIYLSIQNDAQANSVEITGCSFTDCNTERNVGGAIYYIFNSASTSANEGTGHALRIADCSFKGTAFYTALSSIYLSITNGEPTKQIEITECSFDATISDNGGSICYDFSSSSKASASNSNPSLNINNCNFSNINDIKNGGAIYLSIQNGEPRQNLITSCQFDVINAENGGGIYYSFTSTATKGSNYALQIKGCKFTKNTASNNGGSVYLLLQDGGSVEMSDCTFKESNSNTNKECVYIKSNVKSDDIIHITDCEFAYGSVLFDVLSAKVEKCDFSSITTSTNAIHYLSTAAGTASSSYSFTIDSCNFSATTNINPSVIYFGSQLFSKFTFTNNRITDISTNSRVLGCIENFDFIDNSYWSFNNNYISPVEREFIKTDYASKIPADCGEFGFLCELPTSEAPEESPSKEPSVGPGESKSISPEESISFTESISPSEELPSDQNCVGNNRCDINGDIAEGETIDLSNREYTNLTSTDNGGAIRLINYGLVCRNTQFISCESDQGGGGIYIVIKKPIEKPVLLEYLTFIRCKAVYGGAVYIYDNQDYEIKIHSCVFNFNEASRKPTGRDNTHLFGGAAVYLEVKNSNMTNCTFNKNYGSGVKIYSDFESSVSLLNTEKSTISINDCFFEIDKDSSSSLYYVRGNQNEIPVEVKDCTFVGDLSNDAYHIDGSSLNEINEMSKLRINNCKFSSGIEKAVNLKKSPLLFASFDSDSQEFNYKENIEITNDVMLQRKDDSNLILSMNVVVITAGSVIAILVISFFIIRKRNDSSDEDIQNEEDIFELNKNEL